jgi:hypothetical protein
MVGLINDGLEGIGTEAVVDQSRYYSIICLEGPRKTTKSLTQVSPVSAGFEPKTSGIQKSRALPPRKQAGQTGRGNPECNMTTPSTLQHNRKLLLALASTIVLGFGPSRDPRSKICVGSKTMCVFGNGASSSAREG